MGWGKSRDLWVSSSWAHSSTTSRLQTSRLEKQEVASNAESNGAPQDLVSQIRTAATERVKSPEEVIQALQGPTST